MKTTLQMPNPLLREVKSRAAHEGKTMAALVCEFLSAGLAKSAPATRVGTRLEFPLVRKGRPRSLNLTANHLATLELQEEAARYASFVRR